MQAGSLNFLRRRRAAAPLVTLFADVDMLSSPTSDEPSDTSSAPPAAGASLMNAPAGSLILRSTSTADDMGPTGVHSPGTPPIAAATLGESILGGGNAPEARQRGGRPSHQFVSNQSRPTGAGSSSPNPSVYLPQASEMGVAGSAWGTPVQVAHRRRSPWEKLEPPRDIAPLHAVEPNVANLPPALCGKHGIPLRSSNGDGHSAHSAEATSAQSVPSMPGLPNIPKCAGSPELDMGIMPPASPLIRGQRENQQQQRSREEQELSWRSQPAELGGLPAVPATGKTFGTDGGM